MRKNNKNKMFIIIALVVVVCGLSMGFAAFSNTLTVSSSANVKADPDNFKVVFSTASGTVTEGEITPILTGTPTASNAIITNGDIPTVSNIRVSFSDMGQRVIYRFYVANTGSYDAYYKKVYTNNAPDSTTYKKCKALPGTSQESVDAVCDLITVRVSGMGANYTLSDESLSKNFKVAQGRFYVVNLIIQYTNSTTLFADGDFIVEFGDISMEFSSVA